MVPPADAGGTDMITAAVVSLTAAIRRIAKRTDQKRHMIVLCASLEQKTYCHFGIKTFLVQPAEILADRKNQTVSARAQLQFVQDESLHPAIVVRDRL